MQQVKEIDVSPAGWLPVTV